MQTWWTTAWDLIDRSPRLFLEPWFLTGLVLLGGFMIYRRYRTPSSPPSPVLVSPTTKKDGTKALFLARESARQVALAIEKRKHSPLEAYQSAVHAQVLAQTAKDISEDPKRLSENLGVDLYEYLAYTSSVLADVQSHLFSGY